MNVPGGGLGPEGSESAEDPEPGGDDPARIRRRDRAMGDDWIRAFLSRAPWGVLTTVEGGRPFPNANLFVYDEEAHALYLHTARVGRTKDNVEASPHVSFVAAALGRVLPAEEALEFSVEYASVVVFGRGTVVEDPDEARRALQELLDRYAPHLEAGRDYRPITDAELARTTVFRVDVEAWSGKQKAADPGFPGAFPLPSPPVPFVSQPGEGR